MVEVAHISYNTGTRVLSDIHMHSPLVAARPWALCIYIR